MNHVVGDAHWHSPMASVCWWLFPSELSPTGWEVERILFHFQRHCIASLRTGWKRSCKYLSQERIKGQKTDGNLDFWQNLGRHWTLDTRLATGDETIAITIFMSLTAQCDSHEAEQAKIITPLHNPADCSPALSSFSDLSLDANGFHVLETFTHDGDALVELLGPRNIQDAAPLVIAVGHGGGYKPEYIPDRSRDCPYCLKGGLTSFSTISDMYTGEIGFRLAAKVVEQSPKVPYFIIMHLHRSKLDANRLKDSAAQGDPIAEKAWFAYHDYISIAQLKIKSTYGTARGKTQADEDIEGIKGLLIDLHGYAGKNDWRSDQDGTIGPPPFIHWGYRIPGNFLNADVNDFANSTFTHASSLRSKDLDSLIRGPMSIGSRFYAAFRNTRSEDSTLSEYLGAGIPSSEFPDPASVAKDPHWCGLTKIGSKASCRYFSGGYTMIQHEFVDWRAKIGQLKMNTVQAEIPRMIRFGNGNDEDRAKMHDQCANAMSVALLSFVDDLFGLSADSHENTGAKTSCSADL